MAAICNKQGKDGFSEEKLPVSGLTIALILVMAIFFFLIFIFSLQAEEHQRFCSGQGYNYTAYISPNKVCINENLSYVEIKCSGLLNLSCEVLSEEKQFKQKKDFSDFLLIIKLWLRNFCIFLFFSKVKKCRGTYTYHYYFFFPCFFSF